MKQVLSKLSRRRLIELFVRHRYFYNQGNNTLTTLSVIPIEKVAIIAASVKYLLGEHLSTELIYTAAAVYLVYRVVVRWVIGFIWHRADGYDIETEWNKGKIPPSRVEVINCEEIARAMFKRSDELGTPADRVTFPDGLVLFRKDRDGPIEALSPCLGSKASCPSCDKPDWRPSPDSGPREKLKVT